MVTLSQIFNFNIMTKVKPDVYVGAKKFLNSGIIGTAAPEVLEVINSGVAGKPGKNYATVVRSSLSEQRTATTNTEGSSSSTSTIGNTKYNVFCVNREDGYKDTDFSNFASGGDAASLAPIAIANKELEDKEYYLQSYFRTVLGSADFAPLTQKLADEDGVAGTPTYFSHKALLDALYAIFDELTGNNVGLIVVHPLIMAAMRTAQLIKDYEGSGVVDNGTGLTVSTFMGIPIQAANYASRTATGTGAETIGQVIAFKRGSVGYAEAVKKKGVTELATMALVGDVDKGTEKIVNKYRFAFDIPGVNYDLTSPVTDQAGTGTTTIDVAPKGETPVISAAVDDVAGSTFTYSGHDVRDIGICRVEFNV